jgi:hypothetical protein
VIVAPRSMLKPPAFGLESVMRRAVARAEAVTMNIIGTWRLIAEAATDADGRPQPTLFGPSPMGVATFDSSGRIVLIAVDGRSEEPEGKRTFLSYSGRFGFDGRQLTTLVDAANDPAMVGTSQVRDVRFDRSRLILSPPVGFKGEADVRREYTWEKID